MNKRNKIKYKVLEHSADILIEVEGETLGELFRNAAVGMCNEVLDKNMVEYDPEWKEGWMDEVNYLSLADNIEDQLKKFLDYIVGVLYIQKTYPKNIIFEEGSVFTYWERLNSEAVFCDEIKAVTLHMMKITRGEDGIWRTKVLFDV